MNGTKKLNQDLTKISKILFKNKIQLTMYCSSIPICCIKDSTISALKKNTGADIGTTCCRLSVPIDILPDGKAIRCYGITKIRVNLFKFRSISDVVDYFNKLDDFLSQYPKEKTCIDCTYSSYLCSSGCFANRFKLLKNLPKGRYNLSREYLYFSSPQYIAMINENDFSRQFKFESIGKEIIEEMIKGESEDKIICGISKRYGVSRKNVEKDTKDFLNSLKQKGIIKSY
jgi:radical SAM protein with 4Fe4S-binding SPASM domain